MSHPVRLVCSRNTRASTQNGAKGNQWWKRDPFHITVDNSRTLCGRDCLDWIEVGHRYIADAALDKNCCQQCIAKDRKKNDIGRRDDHDHPFCG